MVQRVERRTLIKSDDVEDGSLKTVDIADAQITEAKFSEHFEHGLATGITATGSYIIFSTAFGGSPDIFVSGPVSVLRTNIRPGSFFAKLEVGGTQDISWQAWGVR